MIALVMVLLAVQDDWAPASSAFTEALTRGDTKKLEGAIVRVAREHSGRAAKLLIKGLATPDDRHYWMIIGGLSELRSAAAMDVIVDEILSRGLVTLRRDLMMALQLSQESSAEAGLVRVLKEGSPDLQIVAADELAQRGRRDAIPVLIGLLDKRGADLDELKRQALRALRGLTKRDFGPRGADWKAWWEKEKESFRVGEPEKRGPGETVAETLRRGRATEYEDLKKGRKEEILVVAGLYDEVQSVLTKMSIPHAVVTKDKFAQAELEKANVLLVNCDNWAAATFDARQAARIRAFVAGGGYLFTSDWGIKDALLAAFPGYIKAGEMIKPEGPALTVDIFAHRGMTGHAFLREVFIKMAKEGGEGRESATRTREKLAFQWIIDPGTYPIVYDPAKVVPLVEGPELKEYGPTAVAVTFLFGATPEEERRFVSTGGVYEDIAKRKAGKVLHVLSHFRAQKTKDDDYAVQNMLLNFLIEARDRKRD